MRKTIITAAVASAALLLTACGGDSSSEATTDATDATSEETSAEETEAPAGDGGSITVWVDETRQAAVADAATSFTEETGTQVELVLKNFEDIRTDFLAQVPTGEGPDITVGAHDWLGELTANGVVAPVELGATASDFETTAVEAFTYDGQVYALPYAIENVALIRNADLAPDAPTTWDEMIAAGDAAGTEYSFVIQMNGEDGDPYTFYPLQASFGSGIFAKNDDGSYSTELIIGDEAGENFAQFLYDNGQSGTGVFDQNITYDVAVDAFATGKSPFIVGGPWMLDSFGDINVAVDPIPSAGGENAVPFAGVQGFYLSAQSQNALLANDFLVNYLSSEDAQLALYEAGDRPPALIAAAEVAAEDPITAGFIAAGEGADPMPSIPEMGSVWTPWGKTEAAIINGADPVSSWETMATEIQSAIGG